MMRDADVRDMYEMKLETAPPANLRATLNLIRGLLRCAVPAVAALICAQRPSTRG